MKKIRKTKGCLSYPVAEPGPIRDVSLGGLDGVGEGLLVGIVDRDDVPVEQRAVRDRIVDGLRVRHPQITLVVVRLPSVGDVALRHGVFKGEMQKKITCYLD